MDEFTKQYVQLKNREFEKKVWEVWLTRYPYMDENNFISYEEMLNTIKQKETKQEHTTNGVYIDQVFF